MRVGLTLALFVLVSLLVAVPPASGGDKALTIVSDTPVVWLPGNAYDLRWAGSQKVFVALSKGGVVRMAIPPTEASTEPVEPPANKGGFFFSSRLGAADRYLLFASPFGGFSWRDLSTGVDAPKPHGVAVIMDVDARPDGVIAILGGDRGDDGTWSPDGAIAWTGSLGKGLRDFHPVLYGKDGKKGLEMARCHFLETGAVRFMRDGTLIIVPGVEPDVYRYSASGKLLRTWQTEPLGILDDCPFDDKQMAEMAADPIRRWNWLNERTTLDDVLPLSDGPGLIIRSVKKGMTSWRLVILRNDASAVRVSIPVTSPSPRAHMRGDAHGETIALLVTEYEVPRTKPIPARIVILTEAK